MGAQAVTELCDNENLAGHVNSIIQAAPRSQAVFGHSTGQKIMRMCERPTNRCDAVSEEGTSFSSQTNSCAGEAFIVRTVGEILT